MTYQPPNSGHVFDEIKITTWKNHILLELPFDDGSGNGMSFGLKKAKLILDNIEVIKKFVASDGKEC